MSSITTLIFDLDGTLLDTLQDLSDSVNHALHTFGCPERSTSDIRRFLGNGIRDLVRNAVPADTSEARYEEIFQCFRMYYLDHCLDKTRPYDGILPLLAALKAEGYKMAIVSNKLHPAVQELNERFFQDYISTAIGESETVRRKPLPDGVQAALLALGSTASESVYIGDSEVDFATAQNAGLPCISALWGFRDEDFLREIGATLFIKAPKELPAAIRQLESISSASTSPAL